MILLGNIFFLFLTCLILPAFSCSFPQNIESAEDVIHQLFFCNSVTFMLYSIICFPVPGRPTILITVGQGPIALAVGAGGGDVDSFTLIYPFSLLSPSLWETARYRLKYCLKGPLNPEQSINQSINLRRWSLQALVLSTKSYLMYSVYYIFMYFFE